MATYQTNFSEYAVGVQPADWTARWVTTNNTWAARAKTGAEGGQTLEQTSTADARRLLSWDDIDADADRDDVEILARVRTTSTSTEQFRLVARASGAAAAENAYFLAFVGPGATGLVLNKYVAGVSSSIGTTVAVTWSANTWYWMRFRVNGNQLFGKWWKDGEEEPTDWTVSGTDSDLATAGWVGVGVAESDGTKDFDYVSVATNGDAAPLTNISGSNSVRVTQAAAETLTTKTDVAARLSQEAVETLTTMTVNAMVSQVVVETLTLPAPSADGPSMLLIAT